MQLLEVGCDFRKADAFIVDACKTVSVRVFLIYCARARVALSSAYSEHPSNSYVFTTYNLKNTSEQDRLVALDYGTKFGVSVSLSPSLAERFRVDSRPTSFFSYHLSPSSSL